MFGPNIEPHAPKKPVMGAYGQFCNEKREEVRASLPTEQARVCALRPRCVRVPAGNTLCSPSATMLLLCVLPDTSR